MTHGRTAEISVSARKKKHGEPLTPISGGPTEALESRMSRLEARIAELEGRVDCVSGVLPAHFYEATHAPEKKKSGPQEKVGDTELLLNRDNAVTWLEEHWPQIVRPLLAARNPRQVVAVMRLFAVRPEIRPEWQKRFVGHPAKLLNFLQSEKFRKKPPKKTVMDALRSSDSAQRKRAANRLPTRQIANAMAGVPKIKWRTSLDRCSQKPSHYRVGHNTAGHYRALLGIPEDKFE